MTAAANAGVADDSLQDLWPLQLLNTTDDEQISTLYARRGCAHTHARPPAFPPAYKINPSARVQPPYCWSPLALYGRYALEAMPLPPKPRGV